MHKSTDEMKYLRGFQLQLEAGTGLASVQSGDSKPFHSWPPQRNVRDPGCVGVQNIYK